MTRQRFVLLMAALVSFICLTFLSPLAQAQDEQLTAPTPTIELTEDNEDGEHLLLATVTLDGEFVEGVQVKFSALRTFGAIVLGSEETFDDGTAAVEFPEGIPGDATGHFTVVASIEGTDEFGTTSVSRSFVADAKPISVQTFFPSALWSARPLWPLVIVIAVLLTCVWSTYTFVVIQLIKLRS